MISYVWQRPYGAGESSFHNPGISSQYLHPIERRPNLYSRMGEVFVTAQYPPFSFLEACLLYSLSKMLEFYHLPGWYNRAAMLNVPIPILISRIITLGIAFSVHEFAHAWTADQLGDDTPRRSGRLTLNPLAHLDVLGSLLLIVAGFGWAKPVPINPYELRRRSPAGLMLVSAAGPLSNLLLAFIAAIPFRAGLVSPYSMGDAILPSASTVLTEFISINLILFFFNLIPLAPLDGEKVLSYFLPRAGQEAFDQIRPYGPMILLALLFLLPMVGVDIFRIIVGWPASQLYSMLVL